MTDPSHFHSRSAILAGRRRCEIWVAHLHEFVAVFRHGNEGGTAGAIACFEDGERTCSTVSE